MHKLVKNSLKNLFIKKGFIFGNIIFYFFKNKSELFFFFPVYHIGGAEKVHIKITSCFRGKKPLLFFTERSHNCKFLKFFKQNGIVVNLYYLYRINLIIRWLLIGTIARYLNLHKQPLIFGANSSFFYLLLPYLKNEIKVIDLIHAFGGGFEITSLPYIGRINQRIVINKNILTEFDKLYQKNNVDKKLLEKIKVIENKVNVPATYQKKNNENLCVAFIGRDSPEKRMHLILEAFDKCRRESGNFSFLIIGTIGKRFKVKYAKHYAFLGEIIDEKIMNEYYDKMDLIVLASEREGFPLVVMEAMARGVVPVATKVGGLSSHIENNVNGYLIDDIDEERIVNRISGHILCLNKDRAALENLSKNAYQYSAEHFNDTNFCYDYLNIIKR